MNLSKNIPTLLKGLKNSMAEFNLKEEGRYNTPGFKLNKTSSIKRDWLQKDDQGEIKTSMVGKRDQSGITHSRIQADRNSSSTSKAIGW